MVRSELSAGPVGVHADLNVNTGAGVRGGNLDVHLLGFGGKIGADVVAGLPVVCRDTIVNGVDLFDEVLVDLVENFLGKLL